MLGLAATFLLLSSVLSGAVAVPAPVPHVEDNQRRDGSVTVNAPAGSIIGVQLAGTDSFTNIPYAEPAQRLRQAVPRSEPLVNFDASQQSAACPQFIIDSDSNGFLEQVANTVTNLPFFQKALKVSEDCLNLNIVRPAGTKAGDNLPVLFWIYGGGFELGWNSMYDGRSLISSAINFGKPMVFVAVNYRLGAWGFLGGKEILADGATNLGSLDQRLGLQWVADNIAAFGGDPDKVTIWGESAGAFSVWNHMSMYDGDNTYNGKPLFRGAIMNSGSIVPADPIDSPKAQEIFDAVVSKTSCAGNADVVNCLRQLPYDQFLSAGTSVSPMFSYTSLAFAYMPRPDGKVFTASPEVLLKQNRYAKVPMIIGDQEDEGTLFSLFQSNTTSTTQNLVSFFGDVFFRNAGDDVLNQLVNTYPSSSTAGSPFGTGLLNEIYPGFKRFAAIVGDLVFTLTRRVLLENAVALNPNVPAWSYIASYDYGTPILGTFHAGDLLQVFFGIPPNYASKGIQSYYANFVYNLDPNNAAGGTSTNSQVKDNWPKWSAGTKALLRFYATYFTAMTDDFRSESSQVISANIEKLRM